jgi:thioredoxin 1
MALEITMENYEELVLKSDKPVLLDFYAEWCGPCKSLTPIVEELSQEFGDNAIIAKVNVENCPDVGASYGVMAIPTVVIVKNGELMNKVSGVLRKKEYEDMLNKLL